ncbi:MAG: Stk1 family PASTA domain-containing Ser/Thr kinase [Eubacterium sp.]|nr:Stk1 family PASTA domain-containing Ser/Thr kinase [Eubacterium sp.]
MMINIGAMIGERYEIIEKIGTGGMADVYRAKDHRLNRFVAVKILKNEYSEDAKFVTKFRQEAQAIACLSHPNIVGVYDVGQELDMHYIVMEFVDGITLKKYIERKGKLSVREAVGISLQIANGLEAAHANHIIHRDIKPQNILISKDGTAKVSDFGIAKAASSNTITANAMGSVHYISPEQARGGFSDEKSDIYSLGVSMYEMLSGTLPFTGESAVAIALAHIQEDATPLAAIDATIPHGLSNIVAKCMQKKTELRYPTVMDLIADLKMFLQDPTGEYGVIRNLYENADTIFIPSGDVNTLKAASGKGSAVEDVVSEDEEESEGEVDPKLEKALIIGSITVAIIIGVIIIYLLGRFVGLWGGGSAPESTPEPTSSVTQASKEPENTPESKTQVPQIKGLTQEQAQSMLDSAGLDYKFESMESDEVEPGQVISTTPAIGSEVSKGDTITVYVRESQLPSLWGMTAEEAEAAIREAGFVPKRGSDVYSDKTQEGKVAYTDPKQGENVAAGSTITYYISKGAETVKVPDLLGKTKAQAKSALEKVGLKLGNTSSSYSDNFAENKVCVQSKSSGTKVKKGTKVDITLSLGQEQTYTYKMSGTLRIDSPFDYETDPAATIKIVLSQDGQTKTILSRSMTHMDFPLSLSSDEVIGYSGSQGELIVYKDSKRVDSYNVTFKKVAD